MIHVFGSWDSHDEGGLKANVKSLQAAIYYDKKPALTTALKST